MMGGLIPLIITLTTQLIQQIMQSFLHAQQLTQWILSPEEAAVYSVGSAATVDSVGALLSKGKHHPYKHL